MVLLVALDDGARDLSLTLNLRLHIDVLFLHIIILGLYRN